VLVSVSRWCDSHATCGSGPRAVPRARPRARRAPRHPQRGSSTRSTPPAPLPPQRALLLRRPCRQSSAAGTVMLGGLLCPGVTFGSSWPARNGPTAVAAADPLISRSAWRRVCPPGCTAVPPASRLSPAYRSLRRALAGSMRASTPRRTRPPTLSRDPRSERLARRSSSGVDARGAGSSGAGAVDGRGPAPGSGASRGLVARAGGRASSRPPRRTRRSGTRRTARSRSRRSRPETVA